MMETKKTVTIHVRLEPQTEDKLRSIAKRLRCKRSEAVRRLIDGTDVASQSVKVYESEHATFA